MQNGEQAPPPEHLQSHPHRNTHCAERTRRQQNYELTSGRVGPREVLVTPPVDSGDGLVPECCLRSLLVEPNTEFWDGHGDVVNELVQWANLNLSLMDRQEDGSGGFGVEDAEGGGVI
ncbi:hypothetical protein QAD02_008987 [Eretmocerus hayati]|uniref:Uncharacterized protein n=1 Tax=Eretmocerus hayati TaxID=131215 RepID=A0ACC2N806_9HYME|nr:hypothetical protein QAD02_008987 [Eretmocerus hayati]